MILALAIIVTGRTSGLQGGKLRLAHSMDHGGHGTARGGQRPSKADLDHARVRLRKGWQHILLKAVQRGQARVYFRITDPRGLGIDSLQFRLPPAATTQ